MSLANTLRGLIFKNPKSPKQGKSADTTNPWVNGRRTWNEHVGSIVTRAQAWQVIGILSLLVALASVQGIIRVGSQSKFIPYVVEVDKLGGVQSYGRADVANTAESMGLITASRVASFIADARMVTPDVKLQRDAVFRTYSVLSPEDPATKKITEFFGGHDNSVSYGVNGSPFERAAKVAVSVEIRSVMPQSAESWQVDWIETTRDRQGVKAGPPVNMRALVTVYQAEPNPKTKEEEMWMNPIRLFVRDFSWSKQL